MAALYAALPYSIVDDAYISFRYVMNLLQYGEFAFNAGERLEGATNLAWVLVLAGLQSLIGRDLVLTAWVASLALNAFTLFRTWQSIGVIQSDPWLRAIAVLLVGANCHFALATTNGLEAALFAAVLAQIAWSLLRGQSATAAIAVVALFTVRPDGLIAGAGLLLALWARDRSMRTLVVPLLLIAGGVAAVSAWRFSYFGEWVPNSVIAKSYGIDVLPKTLLFATAYMARFLLANGYLLVVPVIVAWRFAKQRTIARLEPIEVFSALTVALSIAVAVRNGGDWMPHWRLLLQYGPIWALLGAAGLKRLQWTRIRAASLLLWPILAFAVYLFNNHEGVGKLERSIAKDVFWRESTERLRGVLGSSDLVSTEALGFIGYHLPKIRFHDPVGLADRYIARNGYPSLRFGKQDIVYTLGSVRPTVALWHYGGHLGAAPKELLECYEVRAMGGNRDTLIMIRRDAVSRLSPAFSDWPVVPSASFSTWSDPNVIWNCSRRTSLTVRSGKENV